MNDLRNNKSHISFKGNLINASYVPNELHIKELLTFMGINSNEEMIQDIIGYFLHNSIELNMSTLDEYLKDKKLINIVDMRKKN